MPHASDRAADRVSRRRRRRAVCGAPTAVVWNDRHVAADSNAAADAAEIDALPVPRLGESRWPPAIALLVFLGLNVGVRVWVRNDGLVRVPWLLPALEAALFVALLAAGPHSIARHARWVRRIALALVVLLVGAALWSTALLVYDLIKGTGIVNEPAELLTTGALVWLGNNLAFALLFWLVDSGGPIARSRRTIPVDFAFTQQLSPELAPVGWKPVFLDYLHLGFTNSTAFSPTDVMPLTLRAKYVMLLQSTVALALFGLVVARAVNAFT